MVAEAETDTKVKVQEMIKKRQVLHHRPAVYKQKECTLTEKSTITKLKK